MRAHPAGSRHGDIPAIHRLDAPPNDPAGLHEIDPVVWSRATTRNSEGALSIAGCDARELARDYGTPAYLLDEADVRWRARSYAEAFGAAQAAADSPSVYYATKAFASTALTRWLLEEGLGFDVSTAGELEISRRGGATGQRLIMHGNNKSASEIAAAMDIDIARIVLDSFHEIDRVAQLAAEQGRRQRVLVRVTVGVEAHTHEYIATAHEDQKFGFSLAGGQAVEAVRRVLALDALELVGVHSHIGSQIFDPTGFEVAAHRVVGLLARIRDEHGLTLPELDLGGGLGIAYTTADDPLSVEVLAKALREVVANECRSVNFPVPRLMVEPGRSIIGPSMCTLYTVGTVKQVDLGAGQTRSYVSVDGGMSDNIRTSLYDADYTVRLANRISQAPAMLSRVVGKHCETGDVVVRDAWLPADIRPGDLLAVAATGAYTYAMAMPYNAVPRSPVIALREGQSWPIIRRETLNDLFATDVG